MADARDAPDVYWVEPKRRAILPLEALHVSHSLAKLIRRNRYATTANAAFADVVRMCAAPVLERDGPERDGTWINAPIEAAVAQLHTRGHAHSIECWQDGALVGGLYGISLGGAFFGESMFSRARDASKLALAHLVARLRDGGFTLLDCQFMTPHLKSLGALEISRSAYLARLAIALEGEGDFTRLTDEDYSSSSPLLPRFGAVSPPLATMVLGPISGCRILHSLAQTS
jgi:leucyl/phenylalanyl-tRNA---protein transferase